MAHATGESCREQKLLKVKVKKQSLMATVLQRTRPPHCAVCGAYTTGSSYTATLLQKQVAAGVSQHTGKPARKPFLQKVTTPSKNVCFKTLFSSPSTCKEYIYPERKRKIYINCFSCPCLCSISALPLHGMGKHIKKQKGLINMQASRTAHSFKQRKNVSMFGRSCWKGICLHYLL